ncbi:MAG: hypothetical protein HY730_05215 [Candidatus Tectomicrobia bacterium]|uniref:Cytochrome b/b6 C-terminal region profile domain-containing protein n=1 Tax=Tectimicrobiota bacterium TaxID=2528274 RepID=A0A933GLW6_UNCTE|nr:hypothetical protein [Candidatus Tectomicrobia bacterium]
MATTRKSRKERVSTYQEQKKEVVSSFPHLVYLELLAVLGVMLFFIIISIYFNAPLEETANPSDTPNPAKAPWYFVGLQELLVYFDPWIGGAIVPLMISFGLMVIPFLSRGKDKDELDSFKNNKLPILMFTAGLVLWFTLIVIGQFFRGPNWQLYWPWESWNVPKELNENLRSFSYPLGMASLAGYFILFLTVPALKWRNFYKRLGLTRYCVFTVLLALFVGVMIKIMLRLLFDLKYILITPWFNI